MRVIVGLILVLCTGSLLLAATEVEIQTNYGDIRVQLHDRQAPATVANFLEYVDDGFYDGTIFHRIIPGFMIQGGGFDEHDKRKATREAIGNEATNGLENRRGSLAMARTSVIDSATSQFFINLVDNDFLNHQGSAPATFGYAVFGQVMAGMEIVEKIAQVKTYRRNNLFQDYPQTPVVIKTIRRVSP